MNDIKLILPDAIEEELAQAKIPKELKARVEAQFKKDRANGKKINWRIFIKAACESYLRRGKS